MILQILLAIYLFLNWPLPMMPQELTIMNQESVLY
jgi:hypothetical protein